MPLANDNYKTLIRIPYDTIEEITTRRVDSSNFFSVQVIKDEEDLHDLAGQIVNQKFTAAPGSIDVLEIGISGLNVREESVQ